MKILRLMMLFAVSSLLIFTACDSTDPTDDAKETEVKNALTQLDALAGALSDLQSSQMLMAVAQLPDGLIDLGIVLPEFVNSVSPHNLSKNSRSGRFFETLADTTIQDLLDSLTSLFGTHTYFGDQWLFSDNPTDEIIIIYPFIDLNAGTTHEAKIRIHSIALAENAAGGDLEIYVDNTRQLWVRLDAEGTDLFSETAVPTSIGVSGGMLADNILTVNFSLEMTNTNIVVEIGVAGLSGLTLTVEADGIFETIASDGDLIPTSISMKYGEVELVIDNFEAANPGDDMGDVLYSGVKVGDIILEADGIFIVFITGSRVNIEDLLPNALGLLEIIPI